MLMMRRRRTMDREILFRGKRLDNGKWVEGYLWSRHTIGHTSPCGNTDEIVIDPTTVGQYTGLTDKNGVKIFEGDIIRWIDWKGAVRESPVRYDPEWNRFCVWLNGAESMGVNQHLSEDIEVIGSVHDNPELMGGEDGG